MSGDISEGPGFKPFHCANSFDKHLRWMSSLVTQVHKMVPTIYFGGWPLPLAGEGDAMLSAIALLYPEEINKHDNEFTVKYQK